MRKRGCGVGVGREQGFGVFDEGVAERREPILVEGACSDGELARLDAVVDDFGGFVEFVQDPFLREGRRRGRGCGFGGGFEVVA